MLLVACSIEAVGTVAMGFVLATEFVIWAAVGGRATLIGDLAHELEFLYEGLGNGRLRASPPLFGLLQACHDRLAEMLEAVRDKRGVPDGEALIATIKHFRANPDEQLSMPSSVHLKAVAPALEDNPEADDDRVLLAKLGLKTRAATLDSVQKEACGC